MGEGGRGGGGGRAEADGEGDGWSVDVITKLVVGEGDGVYGKSQHRLLRSSQGLISGRLI